MQLIYDSEMRDEELWSALATLVEFLGDRPLTERIGNLENALAGARVAELAPILQAHSVDPKILAAALRAKTELGRVNDLIHALAISLSLTHLMEPGEVLRRPSLASGNDPSRLFDLETDRRIAEFKLSRWKGGDAARKRQVFKDLVHLAADQSGRKTELYVLGTEPSHFLHTTTSSAAWGLDKFPPSKELFMQHFGSLDTPISTFVAGQGSRVRIVDLDEILPDLFAPIA